jgi:tRNA(fMet)-specific endonuclease VapC
VRYLLDTNTVVYFFKAQGRVAERLLAVAPAVVGLSAVSLYELEVGVAKSKQARKRRRQLEQFTRTVSLLGFGAAEAEAAARLRARLEQQGCPIGPLDNLVAGTALAHGLVLVTHNTREFARIEGLQLEDWY